MKLRRVVTVFLQEPEGSRILLGRRSKKVRTYPEHWAGVSGSIEDGPLRQAYIELEEETGLSRKQLTRLGTGRRVRTTDWEMGTLWIIHPFLFRCEKTEVLRRNWEHTRFEWKEPGAIQGLTTVPSLWEAYVSAQDADQSDGLPSAKRIFQQIEEDTSHGAEELGLWTLDALLAHLNAIRARDADERNLAEKFSGTCAKALKLRPSMAPPISAALEAFQAVKQAENTEEGHRAVESMTSRREAAPLEAARRAAETIKANVTVVTLSYSSTVLATLHEAAQNIARLVVGESRPAFEGRRTAKLAASFGIPVTLATDAGAASLVKEADLVLLGADALHEDGSAVNKTGSTALSATAQFFDCHRLFIATESKILPSGHQPEFEQKAPSELGEPIQDVDASNLYFERVPPELVEKITAENGTLSSGRIGELAEQRKQLCDALRE